MSKTYNHNYILSKFSKWYKFAEIKYAEYKINNFNAFILATANNNMPNARVLLLKAFSPAGFIFYTNSQSAKGQELAGNQNVTMVFYWPTINRQIRIQGLAELVESAITDSYFKQRPYLSKIGAWASHQSQTMPNVLKFYQEISKLLTKYPRIVPRPSYWNGYIIKPHQIEFWREGSARLHLRESFTLKDGVWLKRILYP